MNLLERSSICVLRYGPYYPILLYCTMQCLFLYHKKLGVFSFACLCKPPPLPHVPSSPLIGKGTRETLVLPVVVCWTFVLLL